MASNNVVVACLCALVVAASMATSAAVRLQSLNFQVEPKTEECLFQDVPVNSRVKTNVLVTRGGKLDVKYRVTGPDKVVLYERMIFSNINDQTGQVTSKIMKKSFDFVAHQTGAYQFCFDNTMSRWTAKVVDMELMVHAPKVESDSASQEDQPGKPAPLSAMEQIVERIETSLDNIANEQAYHRHREESNRNTAESNNARVAWASIIEAVVLVSASVAQLLIVRRWFPNEKQSRV